MVAAKARAARWAGALRLRRLDHGEPARRGRALPSGTTAIAYEPLWVIGTGRVPTSAEIAEVHLHIRTCLTARAGAKGAEIHILYGGSVTSDTELGLASRGARTSLLDGTGLADDHASVPTREPALHSEELAYDDDRGVFPRQ